MRLLLDLSSNGHDRARNDVLKSHRRKLLRLFSKFAPEFLNLRKEAF